jgi:hypothetical protein
MSFGGAGSIYVYNISIVYRG